MTIRALYASNTKQTSSSFTWITVYAHNPVCFVWFSYQFPDIHLYCHEQKDIMKLCFPGKPYKTYALPMHHSLWARCLVE